MTILNQKKLKLVLKAAIEHLSGDWLWIGGSLLPLMGVMHRTTVDIDLVDISAGKKDQSLKLLDLAEKTNLPIGSINQVAAYYNKKMINLGDHLIS
jgi:hypothetical protein